MSIPKHPAPYTEHLLTTAAMMLNEGHERIFDPFAGRGGIHGIGEYVGWPVTTVGMEIEKEWAVTDGRTVHGDFLQVPLVELEGRFDAIVTSPTYGNRMADHHDAKDPSMRYTYRHMLGRPLTENNSGMIQWGAAYRAFHVAAWEKCYWSLPTKGRLVIDVRDHIRRGERQHVASWHMKTLLRAGFFLVDVRSIETRGMRHGANADLRVPSTLVIAVDKL